MLERKEIEILLDDEKGVCSKRFSCLLYFRVRFINIFFQSIFQWKLNVYTLIVQIMMTLFLLMLSLAKVSKFFLVNQIEHQKHNQTTADLPFG